MNLFISCKHIFGLDNLYIGELGSRVEGRLGATDHAYMYSTAGLFMRQIYKEDRASIFKLLRGP